MLICARARGLAQSWQYNLIKGVDHVHQQRQCKAASSNGYSMRYVSRYRIGRKWNSDLPVHGAVMTISQCKGMISFHTKAEKAYREAGLLVHADQAKAKREELERVLALLEMGI